MASAAVRVEKATSDLLIGPDWTMNMDICDSINSYHWQAKDVVKAVKKRLQNKNPMVQLLALTLLETMIKNCGDYVHFQVVERNILLEMIKIVRKKTDMNVRDKILVLLDSWQRAFGGPGGKYPQYFWAYDELRRSGVEFPQRSEDAAPIFTPAITHPGSGHSQAGCGLPRRLDEAMASDMENLSLSSLDSIRSVMELLNDMLHALNSNDREAVKDEVIVDLVNQCRSNQKKLMQLVNSTVDEELLGQGLALNDNLQSILAKHDAIASGSPLPTQVVNSSQKTDATTPPLVAASDPAEEEEEEEDDDFAQLARRRPKKGPVPSQSTSTETNDRAVSLTSIDTTTTSTATATPSSSVPSGPLALPEPPNPVRTTPKEEQDMIDLLSITLSTNSSSPRTPLTPPSASSQTRNQVPLSPNAQGYSYVSQPYPINQGQVPFNSYVVPWAQPQPQPNYQPQPQSNYQPQPQPNYQHQSQPQPHPNYQPQPTFQPHPHPQPQPQPRSQTQPQTQPQLPQSPIQLSSSYPPPPWAVPANSNRASPVSAGHYPLPTSHASTTANYTPVQAVRPLQQYHSFGSIGNNAATLFGEPHTGTESRQAVAVKPYVPSNRLFEDLVDLRNTDGGHKTGGGSPSLLGTGAAGQGMMGQGMMSGRK